MKARIVVAFALTATVVLATRESRGAATCSFTSTTGMSVPSYDVFSLSDVTGLNANLVITCRGGPTATITLSAGSSLTYSPTRTLKNGINSLNYNLYTSASLSTIWGDGTGGSGTVTSSPANNVPTTLTVYGLIPHGQNATVGGPYIDLIIATMNF